MLNPAVPSCKPLSFIPLTTNRTAREKIKSYPVDSKWLASAGLHGHIFSTKNEYGLVGDRLIEHFRLPGFRFGLVETKLAVVEGNEFMKMLTHY